MIGLRYLVERGDTALFFMNSLINRVYSANSILSETRLGVFGSVAQPCRTRIGSIILVHFINLLMPLQYMWGSLSSTNSITSCCLSISCIMCVPRSKIIFSLKYSSNIFHCCVLTVVGP